MFNAERLCREVAQKREGVKSAGGPSYAEYLEVWNAFGAYLRSTLEQRRGLHLHNFAKIGFVAHMGRPNSAPEIRPHFQLTEQFCRACNMPPDMSRRHLKAPSGEVCPLEDFNFSKAAIKFSHGLSKDQMHSGMKALILRLSEAYAEGKDIQMTVGDIGKLSVRGDRDMRFDFSGDILSMHGCASGPPPPSANVVRKEASMPAHRVSMRQSDAPPHVLEAAASGGYRPGTPAQARPLGQSMSNPNLEAIAGAPPPSPGLSVKGGNSLSATQLRQEVAYKEAMDRHISALEARAAEAIAEREAWASHMDACLDQERDEINGKRQRAQLNLHFIKHQMAMGEDKKKVQRNEDIEAASAHGFPNFGVAENSGSREFIINQQARIRAELDDQVRTNNTLRNLQKQKERTLEMKQLQANKDEMSMLRNAEKAKKNYDKEALATAWNSDIRMKNIWKAIENHHKVGSKTSSHPPQVYTLDNSLPPPSRSGSVASAGRLMTGNSRRVPLGASSSLSKLEGR
mmetsp:Transcript_95055/g.198719  ORF Transcript_95055/g.198719 Transcript_95055/m.198719 type:complete len:514 (-) Transcript_95055:19-1560(-)